MNNQQNLHSKKSQRSRLFVIGILFTGNILRTLVKVSVYYFIAVIILCFYVLHNKMIDIELLANNINEKLFKISSIIFSGWEIISVLTILVLTVVPLLEYWKKGLKEKRSSHVLPIPILFMACGFISCEGNRDEFIREYKERINTSPKLILTSTKNGELSDSSKFSQGAYLFDLEFKDKEKNLKWLHFEAFPKGKWRINEHAQTGIKYPIEGNPAIKDNKITLSFTPIELGRHKIDFIGIDEFGKEFKIEFELMVFDNLPPVAQFTIAKGPNSPYEVIITSTSFDQDKKFGGHLVKGEWNIDGTIIEFEKDQIIKYIYQGEGTYDVSLRVTDNDGAWDETKNDIILP